MPWRTPAAAPSAPAGLHQLQGDVASITAVVKAQGSGTKLVGQMQPHHEARGLSRRELGGSSVPPLVTRIAGRENGRVVMKDFPTEYFDVIRGCSGTQTRAELARRAVDIVTHDL